MPRIQPLHSFDDILANDWSFTPVDWIVEIYGGRRTFMNSLIEAIPASWCSIGLSDKGEVIGIGGLRPTRYWQGNCIQAEAWAIPCKGYERYPKFLLQWSRNLHFYRHIDRIEAFILTPEWHDRDNPLHLRLHRFLRRTGFEAESFRSRYFCGRTVQAYLLEPLTPAGMRRLRN